MSDYSLDARPYFHILHNLIRQGEVDYDPDLAAASVDWVRENAMRLRKVCSKSESEILVTIYAYWDRHKSTPSTLAMGELIREKEKNQGLLDVMSEYEKHRPDLNQVPALDLPVYLDQRSADWEKLQLLRALKKATEIVVGTVPDVKDKTKSYNGPRDALKYFHERMQEGILLDDVKASGGLLSDTSSQMRNRYIQNVADAKNNNLFIPTGIPLIDHHLGGMRRKELNGILGFVGQKKSTVLRTIGYNAAFCGFRVLHIPLESDVVEEEDFYALQHAVTCWGSEITKKRLDRAQLTKEEVEMFFETALPDFQADIAKNIIVYTPGASRAWEDVRTIIERENDKEQVDIVLLDYLTMLSTPGNRDDIADKMAIVQDAKRLVLNANDGKGICLVTPVQGNRAGFNDAAERNGEWATTGISKYSELDKSLDNLFYCYFDDEMASQYQMRMGSCKTRRDANIPSSVVNLNKVSGFIEKVSQVDEVVKVAPAGDKPQKLTDEIDDLGSFSDR